jgi:hypothetical protein
MLTVSAAEMDCKQASQGFSRDHEIPRSAAKSIEFVSENTAQNRELAPIYASLGITDYYLRDAGRSDRASARDA